MSAQRDRVLIFDTTLRDGEQSPGCSMAQPEKLRVARALADLGVDIIEAGFPAASRGDWESVNAVAREVQGPVICGLARCNREDITLAAKALKDAPNHRIHVFLATSAIHRQYKLGMAQEEIIRVAVEGVKIARDLCADVEFSPEDASRTELDFLTEVVEAVIEAGATTVNIPDTVGYTIPDEFAELFRYLRKNVRGIDKVRLSVHCHDDLGMAVANSLTAVVAGARQIECTVNGIGERAGNCSLEEVVMALKTRDAFFNLDTNIDTTRLYPTSRMLANIVGVPIPRNKAVVGENAFAHESGIHQHGMLKHHSTYEIMRPQDVGLSRSALVLGKHSGRHALRDRIKELGFELDDVEFARVFEQFKALADKKKELYDGDIEALVLQAEHVGAGPWTLLNLRTSFDSAKSADAVVRLKHSDGREIEMRSTGDGPVDAALKAIERATGVEVVLRKFEVRSVSAGEDAQGEALVYVEYNQRTYRGSSVSTNIVESATQAFLEVINRIELASSSSTARTRFAQAAV
ncbi:MAG TPA: 2-isopropylmalate synthase [Steroidobacteraceae bacterium]|nr:2-isopropylmalate synthase [Steroidobacteraceae bacterium]